MLTLAAPSFFAKSIVNNVWKSQSTLLLSYRKMFTLKCFFFEPLTTGDVWRRWLNKTRRRSQ
jgi:hypothetical protein